MSEKVSFTYDELTHTTICERRVHNNVFIGKTTCCEEDYPIENKLAGERYAYSRAVIAEMKHEREMLKIKLAEARHIHSMMNGNNKINREAEHLIYRQTRVLQKEIREMTEAIAAVKTALNDSMITYERVLKNTINKGASKDE